MMAKKKLLTVSHVCRTGIVGKNNVCSREVINKKEFFRGTETGATVQGLDRKQQIVYILVYITRVSIINT